jgi:hypothetical protein
MAGAAALLALAGCGGGDGGELRGARGAMAGDTADTAAVVQDSAYDLPVFADTSGLAARPAGDSARPAAVDTPPAPPVATGAPAPPRDWTAGVREVTRTGVGATLREVRFGRNEGFDRMVLDFGGGPIPGYHVEYVDRPVRQCGSGDAVKLAGDGYLLIRMHQTQAHDDAGRITVGERERRLSLPVIREMEIVCDFEGETAIAIGVASPNRYRVMELPNRVLAIDVQQ